MSCIYFKPTSFKEWYKENRNASPEEIWDTAVKECIKITADDAGGFPGPQIHDMERLLNEDWDWLDDSEFVKLFQNEE